MDIINEDEKNLNAYQNTMTTMATTVSPLLQTRSLVRNARSVSIQARSSQIALSTSKAVSGRRQLLFVLTATVTAGNRTSKAENIPLFGSRKGFKKAEEETDGLVEATENGVEKREVGIETAEKEIETAVNNGGLTQASVVAGAEVLGVLVAGSVVNGILKPES